MIQYFTFGLAVLLLLLMDEYLNGRRGPDWTKMKNPFSPEYHLDLLIAFIICLIIWPLILVVQLKGRMRE